VDLEDLCLISNPPPAEKNNSLTSYHCIFMGDKSQLTARDCVFSSPISPSIGIKGVGTHCHLINCTFGPDKLRRSSAGVIVSDGASLLAESCLFQRCTAPAVEVRGAGAAGQFIKCRFLKCEYQAAILYCGGSSLVLEECEVNRCGKIPSAPGLSVGCGTASVINCRFIDNSSEAIVVQGDPGQDPPVLNVISSIFKGNLAGVMFGYGSDGPGGNSGGSGSLFRNDIQQNSQFAVSVHDVLQGGRVRIEGNRFHANGGPMYEAFSVRCSSSCLERVVFFRNKGSPLPKLSIMPASLESMARKMSHEMRGHT